MPTGHWRRLCPAHVEIRACDGEAAIKGNGLFARSDLESGFAVFDELPIPGTATLLLGEPNSELHCAHCTRRLDQGSSCVQCARNCGAQYCSDDCRCEAWHIHHEVLCACASPLWAEFKLHAQECSNEYYIVAARIFASLRHGNPKGQDEDQVLPWDGYCAPLWWCTMRRPVYSSSSDSDNDGLDENGKRCDDDALDFVQDIANGAAQVLRSTCRSDSSEATPRASELASDSSLDEFFISRVREQTDQTVTLLRRILAEAECSMEVAMASLNIETFGRLLGLLRSNALSMRGTPHGGNANATNPDEVVKGMALYAVQSSMNHSFFPNCTMVSDPEAPCRCIVLTSSEIRCGDELLIHYLDGCPYAAEECVQILMTQYGMTSCV